MTLSPTESALVFVEYQNEFVNEGGKFHSAVKECLEKNQVIENSIKLLNEARNKNINIIHLPISFNKDYRELSNEPYGILAGVKNGNAFIKGEWGFEIANDFKPMPNEVVVEGKKGLDGFCSTNLDFILRSRKINSVGICGFLGNCCVESTMRTAYEKGFDVYTITDCVASTSVEANDAAIKYSYTMFSKPKTSLEFIELF